MPRHSLAPERVGQRHAYLGHAVALQEHVPRDLLPPFECVHHQGVRAGDHEPQPGSAPRHGGPLRGVGGLPLADQRLVGGWDGHVERQAASRQPLPDPPGVERRLELARGPYPERAGHGVDDAVDVVERKHVQDAVVGCPPPGVDEGRDLRLDIGVGRHDALGPPGRSARVQDHRGPVGGDVRQGLFHDWVVEQLRGQDETQPSRLRDRPQPFSELGMRDDYGCVGVVHRVLEFNIGVRHGERDRYTARPPDAPLHGHVLEAGRGEKGDPRLCQVGSFREQRGSSAGGGLQQGAVRKVPRVVDHGGAVAMKVCSPDQRDGRLLAHGRHSTRPPRRSLPQRLVQWPHVSRRSVRGCAVSHEQPRHRRLAPLRLPRREPDILGDGGTRL